VVVAGRAEAGLRQGYGTAEAGAGVSPFDGFDKLTAGMLRAGAAGHKFLARKDAPQRVRTLAAGKCPC
jgi:hypothetical protein